jgi:hypothetical protein
MSIFCLRSDTGSGFIGMAGSGTGRQDYKPDDYLVAFSQYVQSHESDIDAIAILLNHPQDWSPESLKALRDKLAMNPRYSRH